MYNESNIFIYIEIYDEKTKTYRPRLLNMTWEAIMIDSFTLALQLNITDAKNISKSRELDNLKVVILNNTYFYSRAYKRYLSTYVMSAPIRR